MNESRSEQKSEDKRMKKFLKVLEKYKYTCSAITLNLIFLIFIHNTMFVSSDLDLNNANLQRKTEEEISVELKLSDKDYFVFLYLLFNCIYIAVGIRSDLNNIKAPKG
jgi:hypothetical protein